MTFRGRILQMILLCGGQGQVDSRAPSPSTAIIHGLVPTSDRLAMRMMFRSTRLRRAAAWLASVFERASRAAGQKVKVISAPERDIWLFAVVRLHWTPPGGCRFVLLGAVHFRQSPLHSGKRKSSGVIPERTVQQQEDVAGGKPERVSDIFVSRRNLESVCPSISLFVGILLFQFSPHKIRFLRFLAFYPN